MNPQTVFSLAQDTQFIIFAMLFVGSFALGIARHGTWRPFVWTLGWLALNWLLSRFVDVQIDQSEFFFRRGLRSVSPETATWFMLSIDLILVAWLVRTTGGSERSCFSPLYFMLPTFALLLLGFSNSLVIYCSFGIAAFAATLWGDAEDFFWPTGWENEDRRLVIASRIGLIMISASCLMLAIYIDVYKPREPIVKHRPNTAPAQDLEGKANKSEVGSVPQVNPPPKIADKPTPSQKPDAFIKFLSRFQKPDLKPAEEAKILKACIGKRVIWDVRFEGYKLVHEEIVISFVPVEKTVSPHRQAVRLAKFDIKNRSAIENLKGGDVIRITGRLERHSTDQLFLAGSAISP
jgi:hypothetical protein